MGFWFHFARVLALEVAGLGFELWLHMAVTGTGYAHGC